MRSGSTGATPVPAETTLDQGLLLFTSMSVSVSAARPAAQYHEIKSSGGDSPGTPSDSPVLHGCGVVAERASRELRYHVQRGWGRDGPWLYRVRRHSLRSVVEVLALRGPPSGLSCSSGNMTSIRARIPGWKKDAIIAETPPGVQNGARQRKP